MVWYFVAVSLHILAVTLWIGHMIYGTVFVEPISKRLASAGSDRLSAPTGDKLSQIAWPCLCVTVLTGMFILYYQGLSVQDVTSGHLFLTGFGQVLRAKLLLVIIMIVLQFFVGPRHTIASLSLLLVGLTVIGLSTPLVR